MNAGMLPVMAAGEKRILPDREKRPKSAVGLPAGGYHTITGTY